VCRPMGLPSRTNSTFVLRLNLRVSACPSGKQYVLTTRVPSLYHWRLRSCARFCSCQNEVPEGAEMDSAYAAWVGLPVVLRVALGDINVPLRGKMLKDGGDTVRMRIDGWDIDIYKTMILAVEEDAMVLLPA
jgi:hypothetical protein